MLKKGVIFFGWTNSEVLIFWCIKYVPLSDPPSLKFMSGDLGHTMFVCVCVCCMWRGGGVTKFLNTSLANTYLIHIIKELGTYIL